MKALLRILGFALAFALLGLAATKLVVRVPPNALAVRVSKLRGGVEPRDFTCGLYLSLPGLHAWYMLDGVSQRIAFGPHPDREGDRPSLEIRTRDNNTVQLESTVTYRVRPGEAHALVREGLEHDYRVRAASTVEDVLRAELRNLSSEDWFDTSRRLAELARIKPMIEEAFAALHLELGDVLIHSSAFPSAFEKKLQEKQIYYQQALLSNAERDVEDAQAEAGLTVTETESEEKKSLAEWNKRLQQARSESLIELSEIMPRSERYEKETHASADLSYGRLVGEGELELERAKAEGERLRVEALAGEGGRVYLAMRAAEVLTLESVELDAGDPRVPLFFDLDQMTRILIGGPR
jgi:regulator of protease activity HflC (stomatin/prohibitin superfamily)